MGLDRDSRAFLASVRHWETAPLESGTIERSRELAERNLLATMLRGEPVARVEQRRVPSEGGPIGVRVYRPRPDEVAPALVFLHGGGWVQGSLAYSDPLCRSLALRAGATVFSDDYRLAPEHPFPAALDDAAAVLEWVIAHAEELGVDPRRVAVGGESAGGQLAAALTLRSQQAGAPAIAGQLLLCPSLDATMAQPSWREFGHGHGLDASDCAFVWDQFRQGVPTSEPLLSPLAARLTLPLPRTAIVLAECDPQRDEGLAYAAKLAAAGTDVRMHCWAGQLHAFFLFTAWLPIAASAVDEIAAELSWLLADAGPAQ
jgi:acetyl esterase